MGGDAKRRLLFLPLLLSPSKKNCEAHIIASYLALYGSLPTEKRPPSLVPAQVERWLYSTARETDAASECGGDAAVVDDDETHALVDNNTEQPQREEAEEQDQEEGEEEAEEEDRVRTAVSETHSESGRCYSVDTTRLSVSPSSSPPLVLNVDAGPETSRP